MASGSPADLLATMQGTRAWLAAAGIATAPAPETRHALVTTRQAIRDVLTARGTAAPLERLNQVLAHGRLRLSVGPPAIPGQTLEVDDPAWRPAVMAAANLLELLSQAPDRIRRCQHPACVLWFYDTTRDGTRRWCSMATCGNRAKAHRHYDRAKKPRLPRGQAETTTKTRPRPHPAARAAMPHRRSKAGAQHAVPAAFEDNT
jgi:predicted RNA-binding Zn ribbon-like protein